MAEDEAHEEPKGEPGEHAAKGGKVGKLVSDHKLAIASVVIGIIGLIVYLRSRSSSSSTTSTSPGTTVTPNSPGTTVTPNSPGGGGGGGGGNNVAGLISQLEKQNAAQMKAQSKTFQGDLAAQQKANAAALAAQQAQFQTTDQQMQGQITGLSGQLSGLQSQYGTLQSQNQSLLSQIAALLKGQSSSQPRTMPGGVMGPPAAGNGATPQPQQVRTTTNQTQTQTHATTPSGIPVGQSVAPNQVGAGGGIPVGNGQYVQGTQQQQQAQLGETGQSVTINGITYANSSVAAQYGHLPKGGNATSTRAGGAGRNMKVG